MQKVIAKISLKNIVENAEYFKKRTGVRVCAVVKADAYGHGAEQVAFALSSHVDLFAVAIVDEALKIRIASCGKEILILTPPLCEEEIVTAGQNGFILTVSDLYTAKRVVETCKKYALTVKTHLKVNTGMNRYGMKTQALGKVCKYLKNYPFVQVQGIYSHLYDLDKEICERQKADFIRRVAVAKKYYSKITVHLSATHGALLGKEYAFDMVRIGLGLYGYTPTPELKTPLKKAMQVYAPVVVSRKYTHGGAGYGKLPKDVQPLELSTLRVGYADGFLRKKDNGLVGSEHNANNLCMDACIRLGKAPRGRYLPVMLDAEETAKRTGTISYEVLCSATRRAERIYDTDDTNAKKTNARAYENPSRGQ